MAGFAIGSPGVPRDVFASDQIRTTWVITATDTTAGEKQYYVTLIFVGQIESRGAAAMCRE